VTRSALYVGELTHARWRPVRHAFTYPVFQLLVDLDELPALDRALRLFSRGRANLFSLHDRDYAFDEVRALAGGPVLLLTYPRLCGYAFNPVSFFYCHDRAGALRCVVADVTSTYRDRHRYVLAPPDFVADRLLHVSPFISMESRYTFRFPSTPPASRLIVEVDQTERGARFFAARMTLDRRPLTDRELARIALAYPLATLRVVTRIHYQALQLWLAGLRFHPRPPYDPEAARRMHDRASRTDADPDAAAHPAAGAGRDPGLARRLPDPALR
jgi:DUF1365 family protein